MTTGDWAIIAALALLILVVYAGLSNVSRQIFRLHESMNALSSASLAHTEEMKNTLEEIERTATQLTEDLATSDDTT